MSWLFCVVIEREQPTFFNFTRVVALRLLRTSFGVEKMYLLLPFRYLARLPPCSVNNFFYSVNTKND